MVSALQAKCRKLHELSENDMRHMISDELVRAHRARTMSPDHPVLRGTAQNPDVYFQGRETVNIYYDKVCRPSCRTSWTSSPS